MLESLLLIVSRLLLTSDDPFLLAFLSGVPVVAIVPAVAGIPALVGITADAASNADAGFTAFVGISAEAKSDSTYS